MSSGAAAGQPLLDEVTAEGVRGADPDALAAVWRAVAPQLIRWLRSQLRHDADAEDVAMETFRELVRDCRQIEGGPAQVRAWVFRAARHNLLDHRRAASRRPEDPVDRLSDEAPLPAGPSSSGSSAPESSALDADLRDRMGQALAALPPDQAAVLTLRFVAQLSAPEIASVIGRSEGAVRQLQHRGTTRLAALIRDGAVPIDPDEAP